MSISEKLTDIKFTKSAIGYSVKEVDGFVSDLLPLVKEQQQQFLVLKAKLEALENQRDEIADKEKQAHRLLEAAKKEAEIIVASAKKTAEDKAKEAELGGEVQLRAATARAGEIIADAEKKAKALESEAQASVEKILHAADAEAKAIIERVKAYSKEETRKAQELSNECAEFEKNFKELVARTAAELAAIKESTPLPAKEKVTEEKEAPKSAEEVTEPAAEEPAAEELKARDVSPMAVPQKAQTAKKRLYDAVPVTYEDESDLDFTDIRDIMKRTEMRKSPTHFSE